MRGDWLHANSRRGELESLGISPKKETVLDDHYEIDSLIENIKQTLLQDYKTAYKKSFE
jgi:hypothetical protein